MPVVFPEVINNADVAPQLRNALLLSLPQVRRITISPALIGQGTSAEQTFTCNGVQVGDFVSASKPTVQAGLSIGGTRVTAANTIGILFVNTPSAGGNITPTASETYLVLHAPALASPLINTVP